MFSLLFLATFSFANEIQFSLKKGHERERNTSSTTNTVPVFVPPDGSPYTFSVEVPASWLKSSTKTTLVAYEAAAQKQVQEVVGQLKGFSSNSTSERVGRIATLYQVNLAGQDSPIGSYQRFFEPWEVLYLRGDGSNPIDSLSATIALSMTLEELKIAHKIAFYRSSNPKIEGGVFAVYVPNTQPLDERYGFSYEQGFVFYNSTKAAYEKETAIQLYEPQEARKTHWDNQQAKKITPEVPQPSTPQPQDPTPQAPQLQTPPPQSPQPKTITIVEPGGGHSQDSEEEESLHYIIASIFLVGVSIALILYRRRQQAKLLE